jgi:very-short-patch-repair endonuclease
LNSRIHNRIQTKDKRRQLRNNQTKAESFLWRYLKNKGLSGRKFRRQHSVGNYLLDFYCPYEKIAIELDGENHYSDIGYNYDVKRDQFLSEMGITVIRIENKLLFTDIESVLETIRNNFNNNPLLR